MPVALPKLRGATLALLACSSLGLCAQTPAATPPAAVASSNSAAPNRPIPDIVALMHDVEANERSAEAIEKDYLYHLVETRQELDGHGQIRKTTVTEYDHIWVNGAPANRLVKRDGKPLTPDEVAKEDQRITSETNKARERRDQADAKGKPTDAAGHDEVTVSRFLALGTFTNPRRVQRNGRDTIAIDYTGNPKAHTQSRFEDAIRDMAGTVWVDEQDHVLAQVEGHFVSAFRIGLGLIVDIRKDTHFSMEQTKVNNEVWLPAQITGEGSARFLLFTSFDGSIHQSYSDYKKFRTSSKVVPGVPQDEPPATQKPEAQP